MAKAARAEEEMRHVHAELEALKRDVAVIKHILSEEGRLTPYAMKALAEARAVPEEDHIDHKDLKKRILG